MECWNTGILEEWINHEDKSLLNIFFLNPIFHYSIILVAKMSFSFQPPYQSIHLCGEVGDHNNQKNQQKSICIDDP